MFKLRISIALISFTLLAGCETTPQREVATAPPADPVRAAMMAGDQAYRTGDDAKALTHYLPLARSGLREAQYRVAFIYSRNKGVPPNDTEACNWWEAAGNQGDTTSANNLGRCFESGKGRSQSYPLAAQWYRRAADGGDAYGMYNLGLAYEYGRGVAQSFEIAASWFRQALVVKMEPGDTSDANRHFKRSMNNVDAARGVPQAQFDLAIDLLNGHEPEVKDERRAMAMMREAATRGTLPEAWYTYGSWLHIGMGGVKSDVTQGAAWVKKAADAGNEAARISYADSQLCGIGVKKDIAAAERLLKQTIDSGSWLAMGKLSFWYQNGVCGYRKDAALSSEWRAKSEVAQLAETDKRRRK